MLFLHFPTNCFVLICEIKSLKQIHNAALKRLMANQTSQKRQNKRGTVMKTQEGKHIIIVPRNQTIPVEKIVDMLR